MRQIYRDFIASLNSLASVVHENAKEKGFHDEQDIDKFVASQVCNMHAELTELWDSFRAGTESDYCDKTDKMERLCLHPLTNKEEELADIIIRALDVSQRLGIDIGRAVVSKHLYNTTRERMHGKKN